MRRWDQRSCMPAKGDLTHSLPGTPAVMLTHTTSHDSPRATGKSGTAVFEPERGDTRKINDQCKRRVSLWEQALERTFQELGA